MIETDHLTKKHGAQHAVPLHPKVIVREYHSPILQKDVSQSRVGILWLFVNDPMRLIQLEPCRDLLTQRTLT